jgi:hypothetical protein
MLKHELGYLEDSEEQEDSEKITQITERARELNLL